MGKQSVRKSSIVCVYHDISYIYRGALYLTIVRALHVRWFWGKLSSLLQDLYDFVMCWPKSEESTSQHVSGWNNPACDSTSGFEDVFFSIRWLRQGKVKPMSWTIPWIWKWVGNIKHWVWWSHLTKRICWYRYPIHTQIPRCNPWCWNIYLQNCAIHES